MKSPSPKKPSKTQRASGKASGKESERAAPPLQTFQKTQHAPLKSDLKSDLKSTPKSDLKPDRKPDRKFEGEGGRDYTWAILEFLAEVHGHTRKERNGDYYYGEVSAISLHFILRSEIPSKEILWAWYQFFERERGEDIYQTLPPLEDEKFLAILESCDFPWDIEAVRTSGLVFLGEHRSEVFLALEESLTMRLDAYETMDDTTLTKALTPENTWSDNHFRQLLKKIQCEPLSPGERGEIFHRFESDYLRATARHVLDQAHTEKFWEAPPAELEGLKSRFIIFIRRMVAEYRRLGVFLSRSEHEAGRKNGAGRTPYKGKMDQKKHYLSILGLPPGSKLTDVRAAYRDQVKQYHPDQGGPVKKFIELQEAYEFLLDEVF